jgi:hypothetical protein
MKEIDVNLIHLHDQIDSDRCNLIDFLREIDDLYPKDPLPEYIRLLYLNYISLSELSCSIKEYYISKDIIIHKF